MKLAIDTNRYVAFMRDEPDARAVIDRAERVVLPLNVLAELRAGFRAGGRSARNEQTLVRFLRSPHVEVLSADDATTHFYAELFTELRAAGRPIPTNDLWIAALCVQHDLPLFTRDKHFDAIERLARI